MQEYIIHCSGRVADNKYKLSTTYTCADIMKYVLARAATRVEPNFWKSKQFLKSHDGPTTAPRMLNEPVRRF